MSRERPRRGPPPLDHLFLASQYCFTVLRTPGRFHSRNVSQSTVDSSSGSPAYLSRERGGERGAAVDSDRQPRERRGAWCGRRQRQAAHRRARAPVRREGLLLVRKGDDVDLLAQPVKLAILLLVQILDRALRGPVRRLGWRGSVCRVGVRCPGPSKRTGARGADRRASGEVEGVEGGRGREGPAPASGRSRGARSAAARAWAGSTRPQSCTRWRPIN